MARVRRRRSGREGKANRVQASERTGEDTTITATTTVTTSPPLLPPDANTTTRQRPLSLVFLRCVSPQNVAEPKPPGRRRSAEYCLAEEDDGEMVAAREDRRPSFSGSRLLLAIRRRASVKSGEGGGEGNSPSPGLSETTTPVAPGNEADASQSTSFGARLRDVQATYASPRRASLVQNVETPTETIASAPRRRPRFMSFSARPRTWGDEDQSLHQRCATLPPSTTLDTDSPGRPLSWTEEGATPIIPDPVWPPNEWRSPNSPHNGIFSFLHSLHRSHSASPDTSHGHFGNLYFFPF